MYAWLQCLHIDSLDSINIPVYIYIHAYLHISTSFYILALVSPYICPSTTILIPSYNSIQHTSRFHPKIQGHNKRSCLNPQNGTTSSPSTNIDPIVGMEVGCDQRKTPENSLLEPENLPVEAEIYVWIIFRCHVNFPRCPRCKTKGF